MNWTEIIIAIIALIGTIVTSIIVPTLRKWLQENTTSKQREYIYALVKSGVYYAEQVMKLESGKEKREYVLEWLTDKLGSQIYDALFDEIDKLLEEIVYEMKQL